ncbi:DUF3152 domain-containing protein [Couchioplanes azureus]|uniref:DUF3152 domain-containing protein n=1 Tax=Couchioplanes caeruleus TaxID=56438 RepID=UPI001E5CF171|nr:DUF3152 domain-containing protein [Couchioplanes caeruleus]
MNANAGAGMRRWAPTAVTVLALLGAAGAVLTMAQPDQHGPGSPVVAAAPRSAPAAARGAARADAPTATPEGPEAATGAAGAPTAASPVSLRGSFSAEPDVTAVLRLPGRPPARGEGMFHTALGTGPILGRSGPLRTFSVAVEKGIGEDTAAFADAVEEILGDERSWTGGGVRLRRVGRNADFTVYLASRTQAGAMCLAGGINIRVDGRPYTSCRVAHRVIINLDRWRLSSPRYTEAKVPLAVYRQYVVNHEVGHELGHRHQGCPGRGRPAPVMVQQTLKLLGCRPYAWPRRNGKAWTGPPL